MTHRRRFLQSLAAPAAAAAAFPTIVKASVLGLGGAVPPSDRVTLATVGVGWMGGSHVDEFLKLPNAQYIAVCDLDETHLTQAASKIDLKYGNQNCVAYHAFEELLCRRDLDAVSIAVPDHWHGLVATAAARAGKDIYCEKPLAHDFAEGLAMVNEAHRHNCIWQTGSWQRSVENFRRACELVRNGVTGKVHTVEVGLPSGHTDFAKTKDQTAFTDPPVTLFYDRWLGPAPEAPYCPARVHKNWRWNYDYGGGQLMDWVGHHVDIAHWGLGFDSTGPAEVEGVGEFPPHDALWNTATRYKVTCKYPENITMIIAGGYEGIRSGTRWIGPDGWVWVDRGKFETSNPEWMKPEFHAGSIELPKSPGHYAQFIASVKSREKTLTPAEVALHSVTPGWLGNIAMFTGRKIKWDAANFRILDDAEATRLLSRRMRAPFQLG
jgi:predicted dehydrogenase